jgi:hypothetical protein
MSNPRAFVRSINYTKAHGRGSAPLAMRQAMVYCIDRYCNTSRSLAQGQDSRELHRPAPRLSQRFRLHTYRSRPHLRQDRHIDVHKQSRGRRCQAQSSGYTATRLARWVRYEGKARVDESLTRADRAVGAAALHKTSLDRCARMVGRSPPSWNSSSRRPDPRPGSIQVPGRHHVLGTQDGSRWT